MKEMAKIIIENSLKIGNQIQIVNSKSLLEEMETVKNGKWSSDNYWKNKRRNDS